MTSLILILLAVMAVVAAVYAFGWVNTPYLNAFRFMFYFLVVLAAAVVLIEVFQSSPQEGYDPTPQDRTRAEGSP